MIFKLGESIDTFVDICGENIVVDDFLSKSGLRDLFDKNSNCSLDVISSKNSNLNGKTCLIINPTETRHIDKTCLQEFTPCLSTVGRDYLLRYDEQFIVYIQNQSE